MVSGHLSANGGSHYYEVAGEGPALVLIPGFTLDTRMWDDQVAAFTAGHRVIRYDLRGAGKSSPPSDSYAFHDDLKALLDALGVAKAHILGLSLGGAIAVDFALSYPEDVLSLILVDTSALGGYPWHAELDAWFTGISAAAAQGDLAGAKELWLATGWFTPAMSKPAVARKLREIAADYSGWHFLNKNPVKRASPPANERLGTIAVPTLVMVGELDLAFYNLPIADRLAGAIPGARKVVLPGVGHMANMEDPERFNDAVLSFLKRIETQAAKSS
jgi:3-oxoadipate enol-lactonase